MDGQGVMPSSSSHPLKPTEPGLFPGAPAAELEDGAVTVRPQLAGSRSALGFQYRPLHPSVT